MTNADVNKSLRPIRFLFENSLFLIGGALAALVWANMDPDMVSGSGHVVRRGSYNRFVHFTLIGADHNRRSRRRNSRASWDRCGRRGERRRPAWLATSSCAPYRRRPSGEHHGLTVHFLINDILMALFFAIAAKEVWESLLPGGPCRVLARRPRRCCATLGGIVGPALSYSLGAWMLGRIGFAGPRLGGALCDGYCLRLLGGQVRISEPGHPPSPSSCWWRLPTMPRAWRSWPCCTRANPSFGPGFS